MPSTYSPTLRIELIGAGEQDGTWGTTTNSNLGSIIEQAITGVQTITFSDANYTLTSFNGLPDEARNAVLVLTGTNTTTRQLIAPAVEKVYVVSNGTGAGVTIKTPSGTGVTVPNGATQIVYCNGTNFELAASQTNVIAGTGINVSTTGINSTVSVNPAVTVTLTDAQTLTNKTLTSPALTSPTLGTPASGTLTNCTGLPIVNGTTGTLTVARGGTGVTTSTGTGSNVLSASPALTGTPTAPTAAVTTDSTQIATTAFVRDIIPSGIITMWSGSVASIPSGWLLCNGSNGTPDLRDRFIVGAGSSYSPGNTGGAASVTPSGSVSGTVGGTSLTEAQMPKHFHQIVTANSMSGGSYPIQNNLGASYSFGNYGGGTPDDPAQSFGTYSTGGNLTSGSLSTGTGVGNSHTHSFSASFSGSSSENRPPYYALAYIMKS
jgi:hypothetical protein